MRCLICDEEFNVIRTLKDLFRVKKFYICDNCLKRYPIKINYSTIPLYKKNLDIIYLFEKEPKIKYEGYIIEFSAIYKKLVETNPDKLIFTYDFFNLSYEKLSEFEHISTLLDKDIIILTNILRT